MNHPRVMLLLFVISIFLSWAANASYVPQTDYLGRVGGIAPLNTTLTKSGGFKLVLFNEANTTSKINYVKITVFIWGVKEIPDCNVTTPMPLLVPARGIFTLDTVDCVQSENYSDFATLRTELAFDGLSRDGMVLERNKTAKNILQIRYPLKGPGMTVEKVEYRWFDISKDRELIKLPTETDLEKQRFEMDRLKSFLFNALLISAYLFLLIIYKNDKTKLEIIIRLGVLALLILVFLYFIGFFSTGT
jgi:hypothetical protein